MNQELMLKADRVRNALLDGMLGLAVADALGVPYESCSLEQMIASPCTEMMGYMHHKQPKGSWSDDTSMSLCIIDSLCGGIDIDDIANKFLLWKNRKQYTATGVVFDIGLQTRRALDRYHDGASTEYSGDYSENGNGNGGLMRTFPIAYYQCVKTSINDEDLQPFLLPIHAVSSITHGHELGLICCGLYSLVLREWLLYYHEGDTLFEVVQRAYVKGRNIYSQMGDRFSALIADSCFFPDPEDIISRKKQELPSQGYVLNAWNIVLWSLLNTDNYRDCVLKAVNLGGDTDTNAAIAGSLAGVFYGRNLIPTEWIDELENTQLINHLCEKLNTKLWGPKKASLIEEFVGEFAFLSMKTPSSIIIDGVTYPNTAVAYFALGVEESNRYCFKNLNGKEARKMYRKLLHTNDNAEEKLLEVVRTRFAQKSSDAERLMNLPDLDIIYDTTGGHDNVLGRCRCARCAGTEYQNLYGKVLMRVRRELLENNT